MDIASSVSSHPFQKPVTIEWVNPRDLLHPARLDVAVKALYAKQLLGQPTHHSGINAKDTYLRHILFRTGGREPGKEADKNTLEAYNTQFMALVQAMQQHGFMSEHAIPVSRRTGLILDGSHRLATALGLGLSQIPIYYRDDVDGLGWDCNWFISQGFSPNEVDEFTRHWVELRGDRAGCVILWPTVAEHWAEIERDINAVTPVVYSRTIQLPPAAFAELIRDIYATDWGPIPGDNIENKIKFFANYASQLRFLVTATRDSASLSTLKNNIREQWHHIVPSDRFATLHTSANTRETAYIADLLLNRANLAALLQRPEQGFRPTFLKWLADYFAKLKELKIDPEACCVVGSGALEVAGVRLATDIDFTVTHQLRESLFTGGVTHLTGELDVVAKDYPRAILDSYVAPTDDDLIRDRRLHVRVRGLKFATLDVVLQRKQMQRRFKDILDVTLASQRAFEG